jgi:selenide,water dikinase
MAAYRMRKEEEGQEFLQEVPVDVVEAAVSGAIEGMTTSNKPVAEVMQEVPVHAATDITGFGLKGDAEKMAKLGEVNIIFDRLAVIRGTPVLSDLMGYPLLKGEAAETAGGMLISVAKKDLGDLLDALESRKVRHFEVGYVSEGSGNVKIAQNPTVIEA